MQATVARPRSHAEAESLTHDPILRAMTVSLPASTDLTNIDTILALHREFMIRGGKAAYLSSPAHALRLLKA